MPVNAANVARGTGYITSMNIAQILSSLLFYLFLPRFLPPDGVGQVSIVLLAIAIFNTVTIVALNSSAIKFVSAGIAMKDLSSAGSAYRLAMRLVILISIPSLLFSFLLSFLLAGRIGVSSVALASGMATGFVLNLISIIGGGLYGLSLFKEVAIQNIIFFASSRFFALAFSLMLGVNGVAFGLLAGSLASFAYSLNAIHGRLKVEDSDFQAKKLFRYSLPLYGYNLLTLAQGWIDVAVLYSITYNLSVLGVYYIIVSSAGIVSVLWSPLSSVLFPAISFMHSENDKEKVRETVRLAAKFILFIVMPVSLALASVSPTALELVYGYSYSSASIPFSIVSLSLSFFALSSLLGSVLQAIGNTFALLVAGGASVAVDAAILYIAVPFLSSIGASIARASMAFSLFLVLYLYLRKNGISIPHQFRIIVFSILCAFPTLLVQIFFDGTIMLKGIAEISVFAFTFLAFTKLLKPINGRERDLLYSNLPGSFRSLFDLLL